MGRDSKRETALDAKKPFQFFHPGRLPRTGVKEIFVYLLASKKSRNVVDNRRDENRVHRGINAKSNHQWQILSAAAPSLYKRKERANKTCTQPTTTYPLICFSLPICKIFLKRAGCADTERGKVVCDRRWQLSRSGISIVERKITSSRLSLTNSRGMWGACGRVCYR